MKQPQSEATPLRLVYVHILRGSNSKGVNTEPQADTQFLDAIKFHGQKEEKWRTRKGEKNRKSMERSNKNQKYTHILSLINHDTCPESQALRGRRNLNK